PRTDLPQGGTGRAVALLDGQLAPYCLPPTHLARGYAAIWPTHLATKALPLYPPILLSYELGRIVLAMLRVVRYPANPQSRYRKRSVPSIAPLEHHEAAGDSVKPGRMRSIAKVHEC